MAANLGEGQPSKDIKNGHTDIPQRMYNSYVQHYLVGLVFIYTCEFPQLFDGSMSVAHHHTAVGSQTPTHPFRSQPYRETTPAEPTIDNLASDGYHGVGGNTFVVSIRGVIRRLSNERKPSIATICSDYVARHWNVLGHCFYLMSPSTTTYVSRYLLLFYRAPQGLKICFHKSAVSLALPRRKHSHLLFTY